MPKTRARDLGLPFEGVTGALNAITDVPGVEVGHTTLIEGEHIRTGVTAILPRGKDRGCETVPAAWFALNGNGEMTGTAWLDETGRLAGPIMLTNTHSVGLVRDTVIDWANRKGWLEAWSLPVVTETYDGFLNDINGFHVRPEHAIHALETAVGGPLAEGNVGGGTGMITARFKGGIGTSSRRVERGGHGSELGPWTVGALVQANYGSRPDLLICGVPVGHEITDLMPEEPPVKDGSIIVVIATDAPLLPHQLRRLAKRSSMGLARTGGMAYNSSGDLFIAFSTSTPTTDGGLEHWRSVPETDLDPLFRAVIHATEEAIINALIAAETMTGFQRRTVHALPHDRLLEIMRRYGRLI
jgi:D-aminopeptidase